MSIDRNRLESLCRQLRRLAAEISEREERFAATAREVNRLAHSAPARDPASMTLPGHHHLNVVHGRKGRTARGNLPSQIIDFLSMNGGLSFKTQAIVEALSVPRERRKSVYMALLRMSERAQIRRTTQGFAGLAAEQTHWAGEMPLSLKPASNEKQAIR